MPTTPFPPEPRVVEEADTPREISSSSLGRSVHECLQRAWEKRRGKRRGRENALVWRWLWRIEVKDMMVDCTLQQVDERMILRRGHPGDSRIDRIYVAAMACRYLMVEVKAPVDIQG